ncbi:Response regulator receiver domain-containing protein [Sphingomonas guangdongensis]|uniref:Response regulator receiver domain-containing protein n=1 Tax=Sphingomonas guangdongensis TaxID=1141890 RepID=A0A285R2G8_9SPHN|nr:response regulator [Sphingomonas guangdongensis]SOB88306.1 Response regulator receiver domain-containing protein [Sphingomonas guangdongensis]
MIEFVSTIDDDADVRVDLRELVSSSGSRIAQAFATAEAFVGGADELEPGVVLLDLQLPGMSGLELLKRLTPKWWYPDQITISGPIGSSGNAANGEPDHQAPMVPSLDRKWCRLQDSNL